MGLKLRYNLFHGVTPQAVYETYRRFYANRNAHFVDSGDDFQRYELYERNGLWTILDWESGWDWDVRREAQLFVSGELHCFGFLVFVFDGDYWGYEFFNEGEVLDRFLRNVDADRWAFSGDPCTGNPQLLASYMKWLSPDDFAAYLVQDPDIDKDLMRDPELDQRKWTQWEESLDVPPRPGDEYTRFSELSVLNFLGLLGIRIDIIDHYVTPLTPLWRRFWIVPAQ